MIVSVNIPLIFGIAGIARSGKDSLGKFLVRKLKRAGMPAIQMGFADAGKKDLDNLLKKSIKISAFTKDDREKKIIRPFLVCYMTDLCRKIDPDFWIKKIKKRVENNKTNNIITVITDVRYINEANWIKENGGFLIHITRMGQKPACINEKYNNPQLKKLADHKIRWKSFTSPRETCLYHLAELFALKDWSTYGKYK